MFFPPKPYIQTPNSYENNLLSEIWIKYDALILANKSVEGRKLALARYNNHIYQYFKNCDIGNLTDLDILNFNLYLQKQKFSSQTITNYLTQFRAMLNRAKDWSLIKSVPKFDLPKFDNSRLRYLSKDEANKLINRLYITNEYWYNIALISLLTGMRKSEIFSLMPSNISLDKNIIYVLDTKNNTNRAIPIGQKLTEILTNRINSTPGLLFPIKGSKPFYKAVEACGLNKNITDRRFKIVFHSLRHTFASWLVETGTPIVVVSKLLGHKSLKMTMRYSHIDTAAQINAINQITSFLNLT
jgi:integrase